MAPLAPLSNSLPIEKQYTNSLDYNPVDLKTTCDQVLGQYQVGKIKSWNELLQSGSKDDKKDNKDINALNQKMITYLNNNKNQIKFPELHQDMKDAQNDFNAGQKLLDNPDNLLAGKKMAIVATMRERLNKGFESQYKSEKHALETIFTALESSVLANKSDITKDELPLLKKNMEAALQAKHDDANKIANKVMDNNIKSLYSAYNQELLRCLILEDIRKTQNEKFSQLTRKKHAGIQVGAPVIKDTNDFKGMKVNAFSLFERSALAKFFSNWSMNQGTDGSFEFKFGNLSSAERLVKIEQALAVSFVSGNRDLNYRLTVNDFDPKNNPEAANANIREFIEAALKVGYDLKNLKITVNGHVVIGADPTAKDKLSIRDQIKKHIGDLEQLEARIQKDVHDVRYSEVIKQYGTKVKEEMEVITSSQNSVGPGGPSRN